MNTIMKNNFLPFIKNCLNESAKIKIETAKKLSQEIAKAVELTINTYKKCDFT